MKYKPISKKWALIHFIIVMGMFILTFLMMRNFAFTINNYIEDKSANYQQEYATIVSYRVVREEGYYVEFITYYEYKAPNGKVYSGVWNTSIEKEEDAIAEVGKQVPIYVDHEKGIHKTTLSSYMGALCFAGVFAFAFLVVMLNSLVRLILYLIYTYKHKNNISQAEVE